jgi:predicted nucleotidyltransferase
VTDRLPELLDCAALMKELRVKRAAAETIMRQLPSIQIEGLRKVYVRRVDVQQLIEARTFAKDEVPV